MIKKIALIFPQCNTKTFGSNEGEGSKSEKTISPPLGILYLASQLIKAGYSVEAFDFNAESYSEDKIRIIASNFDLIGISIMSFNRDQAFSTISLLHSIKKSLPIIVGGPDLILHPRYIENTEVTVCSEAESTIVDIVNTIFNKGDYSQLPGIYYKSDEGEIIEGEPYNYIKNLDEITFPSRHLLRKNKGYSIIGEKASQNITTIITSRGCPKKCSFCAHGALAYQKFRQRSAENVLQELEEIAQDGYKIVGIVDDNFTADKRRAKIILKGIIERKLNLIFAVQGRVDAADPELFKLMKKAGVRCITFGLESGVQQSLDFFNKDTTVEQNRYAITEADKAGLYTAGLFLIGAPHETQNHFMETYKFASSLPLDITSFWVLDYTFGSTLWTKAKNNGIVEEEEFNVPAGKERGTSPYKTEELEEFSTKLFFKFYRRPSYWLRQIFKMIKVRDKYFLNVMLIGIQWLFVNRIQLFFTEFNNKLKRRLA